MLEHGVINEDGEWRPKIEQSEEVYAVVKTIVRPALDFMTKGKFLVVDNRDGDEHENGVLVPTHRSNIDPVSIGLAADEVDIPIVGFLAKDSLSHPMGSRLSGDASGLLRRVAMGVDYVPSHFFQKIAGFPVHRADPNYEEINSWTEYLLANGIDVTNFGEGTRNRRDPNTNKELGKGAAQAALRSWKPLYAVGNVGTNEISMNRRSNAVVVHFENPLMPSDYMDEADRHDEAAVARAAEWMTYDLTPVLQASYDAARDDRDFILAA